MRNRGVGRGFRRDSADWRMLKNMTELLFRDDAYLRSCTAVVAATDPRGIRLDRTVFYPIGGGQPGDTGVLRLSSGETITIVDTIKGALPDDVVHIPVPGTALPAPGAELVAEIDWERRYRLMRIHTCLHLLCSIVPGSVTGGQVGDGKGRLDFDVPGSSLDREAITARLNALVAEAWSVGPRWITDEELAAQPELVRTMSVKPPSGTGRVRLIEISGLDLQPCGGTHIRNLAEIGRVAVTKIENKGKQNRRVILAFTE
jgi:misacylated tRNA(Ala) deacylase